MFGGPGDDMTTDDVSKINKALKDPKFGDMLADYVNEVSDPKNRAEYDEYMEQLEAKGELQEGTELLRCEAGICIKTEVRFKSGQIQKCFINLCHSDLLKDVEMFP